MYDVLVINGETVTESGPIEANVAIKDGRIAALLGRDVKPDAASLIDAQGKLVFPGIIDAHVHLRTAHSLNADTLQTASAAAAFGGVTTLLSFVAPVRAKGGGSEGETYPELETHGVDVEAFFNAVIEEGNRTSLIDFGLHCMLLPNPEVARQIEILTRLGITSFKLMMAYGRRGWVSSDEALSLAMSAIARNQALAMVHAENDGLIRHLEDQYKAQGSYDAENFLNSRPNLAEAEAIYRACCIAKVVDCPVYVVHLSSKEGLEKIMESRTAGQPVWTETCPQYLLLTHEDTLRLRGLVKMAPPLRTVGDNQALWQGLRRGMIGIVATDHAAFNREKQKLAARSFAEVPFGAPGIETLLPLIYSEGVAKGRISLTQLVKVLATNPARQFGLYPRKGTLQVGADADLVVFDPEADWEIRSEALHSAAGYTPFEGWRGKGKPLLSLLRGDVLLKEGKLHQSPGSGRFLQRRPFSAAEATP
ncbi:MAG: dihydropyrimidinase [Deltaproteobacteria bacterium]|nr:dihydropyrimidinase [Deltaproteobacteria bacterium]